MQNSTIFDPILERKKSPRLALTASVGLTELEIKIIDTREFQRLRTIKQLGTSYLVYPSADYSRFEHSLGTLHVASIMVQKIKLNEYNSLTEKNIPALDEQIIRLAALLHDITHVPFGHTLEDETAIIKKHEEDEERFNYFFQQSDLGKVLKDNLEENQYKRLIRILRTERKDVDTLGGDAYISDIVKNTVCSDLLDYIRRDTSYCDLYERIGDMFLNYLYIAEHPPDSGVRRLVLRLWKGKFREGRSWPRLDLLSEMRDLLRVRFSLGQKVYFHHTKIITSAMVSRAVQEVKKSLISGDDHKLWKIGDEVLLELLEKSGNKVAEKLSSNLRSRKLHKRCYTLSYLRTKEALGEEWQDYIIDNYHKKPDYRKQEEDRLAGLSDLEPGDVLIYCPSEDMQLKQADMLITWKGNIKRLRDLTEKDDDLTYRDIKLTLDSHQNLWSLQVFVKSDVSKNKMEDLTTCCRATFEPTVRDTPRETYLRSAVTRVAHRAIRKQGKDLNRLDEVVEKIMEECNRLSYNITIQKIEEISQSF
jgi:hypothetical protein